MRQNSGPVAVGLRTELDALNHECCAQPLGVYVKDGFIELADVNDVI
jgi:hypothetical protein